MAEADLVLEFEIAPGRSPDIENVARALLAWNDAVQTAISVIAPKDKVVVELVAVEAGSQRFKQILRRVEDFAGQVNDGGKEEYPLIWKSTKALAGVIAGAIVIAGVSAILPDGQTEAIEAQTDAIEDQSDTLEEIRDLLRDDAAMQLSSQSFYGVLQDEPAIEKLEVFKGNAKKPLYSVSRKDFGFRSGLFQTEMDGSPATTRPRIATWEVVLVKPVLQGRPRRWVFARDGIEFSAAMEDKAVLKAIHDKTLRIPFAEGVVMRIQVEYKERQDGDEWIPQTGTHRVTRLLSPRISLPPPAMFSAS